MKAELLVDAQNTLGEGVQWNADHARIWWTDIQGRALWSCDADGGDVARIETTERLGSFAFDAENRILAAFESGLFRWDLERDRLERLYTYVTQDQLTQWLAEAGLRLHNCATSTVKGMAGTLDPCIDLIAVKD